MHKFFLDLVFNIILWILTWNWFVRTNFRTKKISYFQGPQNTITLKFNSLETKKKFRPVLTLNFALFSKVRKRSGQSVTASDFGSNGPRFESGPWPLRWVLGQGSLLPLSQGGAFTLASISYLAILVKYILAKKKKKSTKLSTVRKFVTLQWWDTLRSDKVGVFFTSFTSEQSGAAGACWAHNPEVDGSKPSSAKQLFFSKPRCSKFFHRVL